MRNSFAILGFAASFAMIAQTATAQDQSSNRVATKTDWNVFVEDNPKECWGVSVPTETVNTRDGRVVAANRGQILLMVSYQPGSNVAGQVSFTGGYPFRDGSQVSINIGGTDFSMFTEGEWAWPASPSDDAKLVSAMKRGANAVVTGVSSRGTTTKDTFSLLGFTAAVEDAEKRCS
ncbi:invasion associated locus B family protein [uncultured Roseobacter sp.]|uniref:invasion associated locus B family protein n=1 Tax=uncultured Roseobacter sp. TaxID=114847 RepID=UPI00262DB6E3|nr:invasion associated locus B family protein [uncultured Roseobacter sp.]